MNNLKEYILEKLHIDKDIKGEDFKYVLFHKRDPRDKWISGIHNSLDDIAFYIKRNSYTLGFHDIYECPHSLIKEFIKKWKNSDPSLRHKNPVENNEEFKEWTIQNKIRRIKADEINKYLCK